jgi:hypothetical protein
MIIATSMILYDHLDRESVVHQKKLSYTFGNFYNRNSNS